MDDNVKKDLLAELLKNANIGQFIVENNGEVVYNKYCKAEGASDDGSMKVSAEQMMTAVRESVKEGLWWASTGWAVVYRIYCNCGYKGSQSEFCRLVSSWDFGMHLDYACTNDSVSKPLRKNPLIGSANEWGKSGVDPRASKLGIYLESQLDLQEKS